MRLRALLALSLLACSACDATIAGMPPKTLTYTEDARKAYAEAMSAFQTKDWEAAKALFADLKKKFSQTREARLADLRLADIEFATERYTDAISAYRTFVTTFRNDREVEYARYKLAKALFFDISDTFLQPPAEERDQATTMDAHRELRAFMKAFRNSRYQKDVEYMLEVVTGRLVGTSSTSHGTTAGSRTTTRRWPASTTRSRIFPTPGSIRRPSSCAARR